ncbi:transmembrane protein, putative [Bodo saltans]|uniref:Transmembrane protein, putative n=1 Tax=Bodo saltans TaxID=75058 RepID=A0A0S4IYV8_BODSA|nr:transmembrane protein, putative [Bodo saltans]|eukprot:CUG26456.1 transmembrane protein, putative [Bodo saltans]
MSLPPAPRRMTRVHTSSPDKLLSTRIPAEEPAEQPTSSRPHGFDDVENLHKQVSTLVSPSSGARRVIMSPHVSNDSIDHQQGQLNSSDSSSVDGDDRKHKRRRKKKYLRDTSSSYGSGQPSTQSRSYFRAISPTNWAGGPPAITFLFLVGVVAAFWLSSSNALAPLRTLVSSEDAPQWHLRNSVGATTATTSFRSLIDPLRRVTQLPGVISTCSNVSLDLPNTVGQILLDKEFGFARLLRPQVSVYTVFSVHCSEFLVQFCLQLRGTGDSTVVPLSQCNQCRSTIDSTTIELTGAFLNLDKIFANASICFSSWATQNLFVEARTQSVKDLRFSPISGAIGLHVVSIDTKPLLASCTHPSSTTTLTLSLSNSGSSGCIGIETPNSNSSLCALAVGSLVDSASPQQLTSTLFVLIGETTSIIVGNDVTFFSGPQLVATPTMKSLFIVNIPSASSLELNDCNSALSRVVTLSDIMLWVIVAAVLVVAMLLLSWIAIAQQKTMSWQILSFMKHIKVLCQNLRIQAKNKGSRSESKSARLQLSTSSDTFDADGSPFLTTVIIDDGDFSPWNRDTLDDLARGSTEMLLYSRSLVPSIRARFIYYQSFLRKTATSSSRLPQILPVRTSKTLQDLGSLPSFQPLVSVTSFTRRVAHPSLFIQPASPDEMANSGMFSPSQGPRGHAFAFQLDHDASPLRVPSIMPEVPRAAVDPHSISDNNGQGSPLLQTNSSRLFTPRPPGGAYPPQSPMLSAGSPTGAIASSNASASGWSPLPAELPHTEAVQPHPIPPNVPPITISRTAQQSLNVVQAHAMSMSITSTAFLQSARVGKTPRLGTSAACSPAPEATLLPPGHRNKHFHSHHTPRPSYAAGQDSFLHKRVTVLTCAAFSRSVARFPSGGFEAGEAPQSARVVNGKGFSSDSQRFLRVAIECIDQCDGSVVEMGAFSMTVCWNGLSPYPFHEARAVQCAMHMAAQLDEHVPDIGYNFGVVTGGVLVGHVGTSSTMRRCVLGLSVFVSQLLPPLGRMINCSILVSEATYSMARSRLTCAPVEVVLYDGQVMILYEAFGSKDEQSVKPRELDLAHKGFAALSAISSQRPVDIMKKMMAGSTSHAPSHADAQFSRLCRVAKYLEDETTRRMEISGLSDDAAHVSYGRNGPSWLIHEVAADHVRLPDDILTALGDHPGNEDDQESSFSSHPLTPLSGTHVGHSGSRRSSVNPIFELRAELEQQLLERTLRASAHSLFRTPQSAFSHADDSINGVPPMWSPESRRNSTSIGEIPAEPSELMEIVDRRGQAWRRSKKCIGKGTFGEVYVGLQSDGSLCAIKIISLPLLMQSAAATAPNRPPGGGKDRLGQSAVESAVSWGEGSLMQQKLAAMTSLGSTNTKDNFDPHADSILGSSMFQFDPGNAPPPTTPLNPSLYSPRPPPSMLSREVDQLLQEVATLSSIKSDNVVRYYGCAVNDGSICIVMEYVGGGSLTSLMGLFGTFPLPSARRFVMDVLRGLRALHEQRIVHRDVGPNNILVTIDGVCKLSDFGCSQSLQKISAVSTRAVAGTPQYMAPEACRGEATTASDIWSLGVLAHVLVTGRLPFADADLVLPPELFIRKMALIRPSSRRPSASKVSLSSGDDSSSGLQSFISGSTHLPMTVCVLEALLPSDALEFVQVCLLRDQTMRPTADQLMMHPFVLK